MPVTVLSAMARDQWSEEVVYELVRRLIVSRFGEFERVRDITNKICDRYQVEKLG